MTTTVTPSTLPPALAAAVADRLERMRSERVVARLWERDHTLWHPEPAEITNRLGWLDAPGRFSREIDRLKRFAADVAARGFERAVLLGMGGSSLAPEVLFATYGRGEGGLAIDVLDSTDPAQVAAVEARMPLERTLFIVASKSGGTIETLSHAEYFWSRAPRGEQFVAITDPGSGLERLARERGFLEVFLNPEDIGGRYSALTYFGLVAAALAGVDLEALLAPARAMADACREQDPSRNPGAWLGAVLGEAALQGQDQLTFVLPRGLDTLGTWLEQLIAESTGKLGHGILPIEGEPLGAPSVYARPRLFAALGDEASRAGLDALAEAGHPVVRLPEADASSLGAEFFRWEFATAVAGYVLGVQPFDQPDVQAAKDATGRVLASGGGDEGGADLPSARDLLAGAQAGDYLAILAFVPRSPEVDARLQRVRVALRDRLRVATTIGYGPRYLHSTGQLHKGGPANGVFIEVVGDDPEDLAIPGTSMTFGTLKQAQALGDLQALVARGRRVARASIEELESLA
ncbi:MAG: glucose-6-phosphate isomerase [Dehalococcoidia bacterium]|nr:glucose-6-phosphate isomerase [Dehalococcoidia bacterium]